MTELATGGVALDPLDVRLGRVLAARCGEPHAETIGRTATLIGSERARGHACIVLSEWAGKPLPWEADGGPRLPDLATWKRSLQECHLVGDGDVPTPLVLDGERCYLYRYWVAEREVAAALRARLDSSDPLPLSDGLRRIYERAFPHARSGEPDFQAVAAGAALARRVVLISGGPGTGKTTVVARILALWRTADPDMRVALAAPTGKAAQRLTEAVHAEFDRLASASGPDGGLADLNATTIHRLLGASPGPRGFRYDEEEPLPVDAVVVDEASMVDLSLFHALIRALPWGARLVLLGDRHQLASVETGFVFGDVCEAAAAAAPHGARSRSFAEYIAGLGGPHLQAGDRVGALADSFAELTVNYRFGRDSGIGRLAEAVKSGDSDAAIGVLTEAGARDLMWLPMDAGEDVGPRLPVATLEKILRAKSPEEALRLLSSTRILCALRGGPRGVDGLNVRLERLLGLVSRTEVWYAGRPVLVTANDHHLGLYNGDVGVCFYEGGRPFVWFPGTGGVRHVTPSLLPAHETAWAMTVHKAQGSEFDHVILVLPRAGHPLATRELLYTGITRARRLLEVVGDEAAIRAAVETRHRRASGLAARLSDEDGAS
ncbi:MAG: exodeoxyribonuclease V subunit alpha [Candidatus Dadabacteria bacterium]|nr:MAG: exodeoxyribonuclease V subunit alpha [Candidatus Dadabacteria bacterium]